ncbi:MAG: ImmA/IrrE family metallo-endopeptidase [Actinomycetes bacterium]
MSRNERVARARAETFRDEHALGLRPLGDLFELAHAAMRCDALAMDADEVEHGLSMLDPVTGRIAIVVATTSHPMRQRSSLAHEIGHVVGGDLEAEAVTTPGERSPAEIQADAFARHLLLPVAALRERFGPEARRAQVGEAELADVVQEFEVSPSLAAIQFREARLIDRTTCTGWMPLRTASVAARYGWLSQYQALALASTQPRAPQTLMRRAVEGYHRGIVDLDELAAWYGESPDELRVQLGPPRDAPEESDEYTGGDHIDDLDEDRPLFPPGFGAATPTS